MLVPYQTKVSRLSGTSLAEVMRSAHNVFDSIKHKTKRRPYIRSAYFKKEKIFFDFFWEHLGHKSPRERFERLKYFYAAVELVECSHQAPVSKVNSDKKNEIFHRFAGLTREKELFFVQVKENTRTHRKYFMSCFSPS